MNSPIHFDLENLTIEELEKMGLPSFLDLLLSSDFINIRIYFSGQVLWNWRKLLDTPWKPRQFKEAFDSFSEIFKKNYLVELSPPTLSSALEDVLEISKKKKIPCGADYVKSNTLSMSMLTFIQKEIRNGRRFIFLSDSQGSSVYLTLRAILMDLKIESHIYSLYPHSGFKKEEHPFLRSHSCSGDWKVASGIKVLIDLSNEISTTEMIGLVESVSPQIIVTNRYLPSPNPHLSEILYKEPVFECTQRRYFDGSRRIDWIREVRKNISGEYLEYRNIFSFEVKSYKDKIEGEFREKTGSVRYYFY